MGGRGRSNKCINSNNNNKETDCVISISFFPNLSSGQRTKITKTEFRLREKLKTPLPVEDKESPMTRNADCIEQTLKITRLRHVERRLHQLKSSSLQICSSQIGFLQIAPRKIAVLKS